jgi:hydrogenase/urease accessory protein HupE
MKRGLSVLSLIAPSAAVAHPGEHQGAGIFHLLTEPDHLAMMAVGAAVAVFVVLKWRSRS